jgi:stearoyl-CoA desaturase (delta-9 desaturase)
LPNVGYRSAPRGWSTRPSFLQHPPGELAAPVRIPTDGKGTGIGLIVLHLGTLLALIPATFSWSGVAVAFVLCNLTGGLGLSLGFHRMLTHQSLRVPRWLNYTIAVFGVLGMEGGPITWVATHRRHHANSHRDGEPHNGRRGLRWSHMEWLYRPNEARPTQAEMAHLTPDLAADPFYAFLERTNLFWQIGLGLALLLCGGVSWVIWGMFVRVIVTIHVTGLVNSVAHHFGYQTYRTGDESRNNWWVAMLTWGDGWHNNHHAFPASARHGLRWFELDTTWWTICALEAVGLAHDVRLPSPAALAREKSAELRADRL